MKAQLWLDAHHLKLLRNSLRRTGLFFRLPVPQSTRETVSNVRNVNLWMLRRKRRERGQQLEKDDRSDSQARQKHANTYCR
jgi:hypothetical protein